MARIWGIIRKKDKISYDTVLEQEHPDLDIALDELCKTLDIPRPVVLMKHRNEFMRFYRTRFVPSDFVESIGFAVFEVEELRERKQKDAASAASR